jgi:hypothetical protein
VPVPARAEVANCADAVRQQADALMLSGETAAGKYAIEAVQTLPAVSSIWACETRHHSWFFFFGCRCRLESCVGWYVDIDFARETTWIMSTRAGGCRLW